MSRQQPAAHPRAVMPLSRPHHAAICDRCGANSRPRQEAPQDGPKEAVSQKFGELYRAYAMTEEAGRVRGGGDAGPASSLVAIGLQSRLGTSAEVASGPRCCRGDPAVARLTVRLSGQSGGCGSAAPQDRVRAESARRSHRPHVQAPERGASRRPQREARQLGSRRTGVTRGCRGRWCRGHPSGGSPGLGSDKSAWCDRCRTGGGSSHASHAHGRRSRRRCIPTRPWRRS